MSLDLTRPASICGPTCFMLTDAGLLAVLCWTTPSMATPAVGDAITVCTVFMVRSAPTSRRGCLAALLGCLPGRMQWPQSASAHATWLPIWQFHSVAHTCSLWQYKMPGDSVPVACHTWTGISSLEHAQDLLKQDPVSFGPMDLRRTACRCCVATAA